MHFHGCRRSVCASVVRLAYSSSRKHAVMCQHWPCLTAANFGPVQAQCWHIVEAVYRPSAGPVQAQCWHIMAYSSGCQVCERILTLLVPFTF